MSLRILYIESSPGRGQYDQDFLRERGLRVYPCSPELAEAMIGEVKPDLCCVEGLIKEKTGLRKAMGPLPLVASLTEDELYWVERTEKGRRKSAIADNLLDGIRQAMGLSTSCCRPDSPRASLFSADSMDSSLLESA